MITFKLPTRKYSYFSCQMNSCRENGLFMFCLQILVKKYHLPLINKFHGYFWGCKKNYSYPPKIFLVYIMLCGNPAFIVTLWIFSIFRTTPLPLDFEMVYFTFSIFIYKTSLKLSICFKVKGTEKIYC